MKCLQYAHLDRTCITEGNATSLFEVLIKPSGGYSDKDLTEGLGLLVIP